MTAKGSIFSNGPANYFRLANNPPDLAETTSQCFSECVCSVPSAIIIPLRIRPEDYYGFAAFFLADWQ